MAPLLAKLKAPMYISKGLEKSFKVKTGAEHNNFFSFSNDNYCSVPKIHSCCYYVNLVIDRTT